VLKSCGAETKGNPMSAHTALLARPLDFGVAGPLGSFDAYVERVGRVPVLSFSGADFIDAVYRILVHCRI